ncbi:MAG: ATP-grasp domain-containing protein [Actinomycetia bacterium]|nr:ATP-grasp domain-containing protein [Actinomycetes bacterium]
MRRVLIANRGEIAVRIARACADLAIESVAVYSAADTRSLHVKAADLAVAIQGAAIDSYLDIDQIVSIATANECDAIHPGYGFLAEDGDLARACAAAGITFVGPTAEALDLYGDKIQARNAAVAAGVPVIAGTDHAVGSVAEAAVEAEHIGYPVMLKAAAGGGGRGLRLVTEPEELPSAYERCRSEAGAAFNADHVFVERYVEHPRHIEVQILGDHDGNIVHLHERDCSVQARNQKVIEMAPSAGLDPDLRSRILTDAVKLAGATGFTNAGTIEFLVIPETGEHFFVEGNPRIQVEHTVTEETTGIDLVASQLHIAAGATLPELGLFDQAWVPEPRGFSVQARVVATGHGTINAYHDPTGPGIRVDGHAYTGYSPAPQYDPLLAKIIATSPDGSSPTAALNRLTRALDELHIAGLTTNIGLLKAIAANPAVHSGDARTTLLSGIDVQAVADRTSRFGELLASTSAADTSATLRDRLRVDDSEQGVAAAMAGSLVGLSVETGDEVSAGDSLGVISAMKMETELISPCTGIVTAVADIVPGDSIAGGEIVIVIESTSDEALPEPEYEDTWGPTLDQVKTLQDLAHRRLAPGSDDPGVVRQRSRDKLTCRERIALLLDDGSFREIGSLAGFTSYDEYGDIVAFTPANHVGGAGRIEGRPVVVCADDFTSRGGHSDGAIGAKSFYLDQLSIELLNPAVRLLDGSSGGGSVASMVPKNQGDGDVAAKESSGAIKAGRPRVSGGGGSFLPPHLGASEYAEQLSTVPVVNILLGSVVGLGAAKAVLGHFSVMVRDIAQLFVAGPPVVSHAMGYDVTKEDLGDWRIHCRNGSVDNLADSEGEAVEMTRQFLSYLPSSVHELPPVRASDDPADRSDQELFTIVPRKRTATFDIRRAIELIADKDSFFEVGPMWGSDQVVGFVRMAGRPLGVVATDSRHENGGAMTADGCDKITRHLDLCELFNVPVLNLVDNPGFAVGIEHEQRGTIRKGGEWMIAFAQVRVPIFTVLMRRSFGVAGNGVVTPRRRHNTRVTWPSADAGGIPPEGGIEAAYKRQLAEADDPVAFRAELMERIESARGPVGPLNRFELEEMIDPRDTRRHICEWVETAYRVVEAQLRSTTPKRSFRP